MESRLVKVQENGQPTTSHKFTSANAHHSYALSNVCVGVEMIEKNMKFSLVKEQENGQICYQDP